MKKFLEIWDKEADHHPNQSQSQTPQKLFSMFVCCYIFVIDRIEGENDSRTIKVL